MDRHISTGSAPRRAALAATVAACMLASGCGGGGEPRFKGEVPARPVIVAGVSLPEVRADGRVAPFTMRARPGGLLLVFFGFVNCPDICPTTLSDTKRALDQLGSRASDVDIAFVTVDPQRDSAQVMLDYLGSFFERGSHALRPATQAQLGRAQTAFRATSTVTRETDGHIDVSHTATTHVVDAAGRVVLEWPFGTPAADMAHDLRLLTAAAARGLPPQSVAPEPLAATSDGLAMGEAWVRASPRGATMGAAYLALQSTAGDRLLGVSVSDSLAERMEMHEIVAARGGALRMQRVSSIELPPGERIVLQPGGRHLMFIGLRQPLVAGETIALRLRFERAGERVLSARVRGE